jgi:hypothetical protein
MPGLETKGSYKKVDILLIIKGIRHDDHDYHDDVCVRIPSIHNQQPTVSHSRLVASNFSKRARRNSTIGHTLSLARVYPTTTTNQARQIDCRRFHCLSLSGHYTTDPYYYLQRTQQLSHLAAFLGELATQFEIAVVVLNQMTTKVDDHENNNGGMTTTTTSRLVPTLGESWAHATTTRLLLSHNNKNHNHNHHRNNTRCRYKTRRTMKRTRTTHCKNLPSDYEGISK